MALARASLPPADDRDLIMRWADGDETAFAALVERHAPYLGRLVRGLVDDPSAVEDLVQETFVRAYRGLDAYRGGDVRAWLGRIAVNAAHGLHRSSWRRRVTLEPEPLEALAPADDEPEAATFARTRARAVRIALARLPQEQAEPIRLHFLAGESYLAIAALLDCHESTIRSRVKAGLARLRRSLGRELAEDE
jgi:RNA polymerase sigma-70 factor (ECF subfamily)